MSLSPVRDALNEVNRLLREYNSVRDTRANRERRSELLHQATQASISGVEALLGDERFAGAVPERDDLEMTHEIREDEALVRLFLNTERRLLQDLGVDPDAADLIVRALEEALHALDGHRPESIRDSLEGLRDTLQSELQRVETQGANDETVRKIRGAFMALGGGTIVFANGAVAASGILGGPLVILTAGGAALSIAGGQILMDRGSRQAMGR
jgi:hypothetical protein